MEVWVCRRSVKMCVCGGVGLGDFLKCVGFDTVRDNEEDREPDVY
jgi:hypothetical protein